MRDWRTYAVSQRIDPHYTPQNRYTRRMINRPDEAVSRSEVRTTKRISQRVIPTVPDKHDKPASQQSDVSPDARSCQPRASGHHHPSRATICERGHVSPAGSRPSLTAHANSSSVATQTRRSPSSMKGSLTHLKPLRQELSATRSSTRSSRSGIRCDSPKNVIVARTFFLPIRMIVRQVCANPHAAQRSKRGCSAPASRTRWASLNVPCCGGIFTSAPCNSSSMVSIWMRG